MDLGLKNKVAIVTEGTTTIGTAIARALADEGAVVAFAGADAAAIARAQAELRDHAANVAGMRADIASPADVRRLVDDTLARFGRVDIVVSNAGAEVAGTIDDVTADQVSALMLRKIMGPWELARAVAPHLRRQGSGRFVVVISDAGKIPGRSVIASAVAGAAQHAFVKSLSDDLGRSNVLVTGVSVGHIGPAADAPPVARDLYISRSLAQQESRWAADVPLGRWGTAADVANAVAFLCSGCSSFISGSNLDVDGGDQRSIF